MSIPKPKLEVAIWLGLWIVESALTRSHQPTITMSLLATGILSIASAGLLSFVRFSLSGSSKKLGRPVLIIIGVVCALGVAAAVMIRGLYVWLYPEVLPFGLALNIAVDTAWVAFHAFLVGCCLCLLSRRG